MSLKETLFAPHERKLFEHTALKRERLEEQYTSLEQQNQAASFGMWVFLITEVMFFGNLFVVLGTYWILYTEPVATASEKLCWEIGGTNTIVLLVSSLMMALAVHAAERGEGRKVVRFLLATAALGVCFLLLKALEYYVDYREYLIPGWRFDGDAWITREHLHSDQLGSVQIFLLLYWIMTGLHALHVTIGIVVILVVALLAHRNHFSTEYYSPVEVTGLYWHFVDVVWIFLFPMLYLLGTHTVDWF